MTRSSATDARAPLILGLVAALALLSGIVLWAGIVPIAGAVVVSGEVDAARMRHPVQHPEGGLVERVAVQDGQSVSAGDLLMRLDGALLHQEWQLVEAQLREIEARALRLRAERDGAPWPDIRPAGGGERDQAHAAQRRLFEARADTLRRQAAQLSQRRAQAEAELAGLSVQDTALTDEAALLAEGLERHRALHERGLSPADRVALLEREAVQLAGRQGALRARQAELRGQIAEIVLQSETLNAARREEAEAQLAETVALQLELLSRRTVLAERRARLELRAPVAGRVHALAVTVAGVVLSPGDTVMQIIPQDAEAQITVRLRPDDIDRVYPGQPAQLRIPAFPDLDMPPDAARVRDVSPAGLIDERSGARFFRATLDLTGAGRTALGGRQLVPGMSVQAFIATEARSPLSYLLEPVQAQMHRAMREP